MMKVLAAVVLIWLICSLIGSVFHILGSLIWVAVVLSVIAALWGFLQKE